MDLGRNELLHILMSALDGLDEELMLVGPTGRTMHENPAMRHLLRDARVAAKLRAGIRRLTCLLTGAGGTCHVEEPRPRSVPALGDTLELALEVHDVRVHLRAQWIGGSPQAEECFVLVCVQRVAAEPSPLESLRQRFLLTCQEARVALLLARRRSNNEIARELGVSPHTARHHTEHILSKLGVHSRIQVAAVVGAAVPTASAPPGEA
jgi:DNA-binding CsgD family transcriptional regulator